MLGLDSLQKRQIYSVVLYSMTIGVILYELGSALPYIFDAPIVARFFYMAGTFVLFYFPASTVMSRTFRYMKLHEEVTRLSNIIKEQHSKKHAQRMTLNRYRRIDEMPKDGNLEKQNGEPDSKPKDDE